MTRGPVPKPVELKLLQGTFRADRDGKGVLGGDDLELREVPDHLTAEGAEAWIRIGKLGIDMGVLKESDRFSFMCLCEDYAQWMALKADIAVNGRYMSVETGSGSVVEKPRPQVADLDTVTKRVLQWFMQFGLTPSSRQRVPASRSDGDSPENKLQQFLSGKR